MRAVVLVKNDVPEKAFEVQEMPDPVPSEDEVLIKVEAFGLNFADISARNGIYQDCPPLPTIIGYEVVGRIEKTGESVSKSYIGKRVVGFTRFGGYATYAVTKESAIVEIPDDMPLAVGAALATQYCTAYYCAEEATTLNEGETVLVQAAAGGVGTGLVQLAKQRKCIVFGTASSAKKLEYLKDMGVDYPINYKEVDFVEAVKKIVGKKGIDVVFDSIGGKSFKKAMKLLADGGRIIGYGAAEMNVGRKSIWAMAKTGLGFGFFSPISLLTNSQSVIGVNMLRIADHKPEILKKCLQKVVELTAQKKIRPVDGGVFSIDDMAKAHHFIEQRKSVGKVVVKW